MSPAAPGGDGGDVLRDTAASAWQSFGISRFNTRYSILVNALRLEKSDYTDASVIKFVFLLHSGATSTITICPPEVRTAFFVRGGPITADPKSNGQLASAGGPRARARGTTRATNPSNHDLRM
ncbi:hypothetical protein EVAR_49579_1 [Eumeta japonica]|uniref:Uncharacterized protein n=1 Tax=Eumeta variegata TaxID=151549 RepID=A0A4C1YLJ9_EUMVA|nr:hypothetical protein EVAR_49579_1 [Eumeta japonica]